MKNLYEIEQIKETYGYLIELDGVSDAIEQVISADGSITGNMLTTQVAQVSLKLLGVDTFMYMGTTSYQLDKNDFVFYGSDEGKRFDWMDDSYPTFWLQEHYEFYDLLDFNRHGIFRACSAEYDDSYMENYQGVAIYNEPSIPRPGFNTTNDYYSKKYLEVPIFDEVWIMANKVTDIYLGKIAKTEMQPAIWNSCLEIDSLL